MTSFDEVVQEYLRRLEEATLSFGVVNSVFVSRRVWDIIATPSLNLVEFDPWDTTRAANTIEGAALIVREDFGEDRIEIVCHRQTEVFEAVRSLVLNTLRETRANPELIEMGTDIWALYQGSYPPKRSPLYFDGISPLQLNGAYHFGIPIKIVEGDPHVLRVKQDNEPPAWCQVGVCIGKKDNPEVWGVVLGRQAGSILLDELRWEYNVAIPVSELRGEWEWIPTRPRIRDRFSRILLDEG